MALDSNGVNLRQHLVHNNYFGKKNAVGGNKTYFSFIKIFQYFKLYFMASKYSMTAFMHSFEAFKKGSKWKQ